LLLASCGSGLLVISYNVENLFDDTTSGEEYAEYRGQRWAGQLYPAKLAAVARAIRSCSPRGPDLIALQEVESVKALTDLRDRHLQGLGYRQLVFVPQPGALTGVGFLSRVEVTRVRAHSVGSFAGEPLRYLIELELEYRGRSLIVLNNHWKSKTEGVEATAGARRQAARVLARRLAELLSADPGTDLLALGDFNENLEELEVGERLRAVGRPQEAGLLAEGVRLYDPWLELPASDRGSAAYQGRWQTPDHILLAPGLFDARGFSYRPGDFRVMRRPFLVRGPQGFPWRFQTGSSSAGERGVSDHLPLCLDLKLSAP
jgi:endonuclease/exonuclease/phosphatase family metal-dependent hydrolase